MKGTPFHNRLNRVLMVIIYRQRYNLSKGMKAVIITLSVWQTNFSSLPVIWRLISPIRWTIATILIA